MAKKVPKVIRTDKGKTFSIALLINPIPLINKNEKTDTTIVKLDIRTCFIFNVLHVMYCKLPFSIEENTNASVGRTIHLRNEKEI